jgi:hypothetical protein
MTLLFYSNFVIFNRHCIAGDLQKLIENALDFSEINKKEFEVKGDTLLKFPNKEFSPRPYSEMILEKYNIGFDIIVRLWSYDEKEGILKSSAEDSFKSILRREYLISEHLRDYYINFIFKIYYYSMCERVVV